MEVYLNNNFVYGQGTADGSNSTGFASLSAVQTATTGFQLGQNTLEMRIINAGSYTGGVITGTVTGEVSQAPEPATFLFGGLGLAGIAIARLRKTN